MEDENDDHIDEHIDEDEDDEEEQNYIINDDDSDSIFESAYK